MYVIGNYAPNELPNPSTGIDRDRFIAISMSDVDRTKIRRSGLDNIRFALFSIFDCFECVVLMGSKHGLCLEYHTYNKVAQKISC